MPCTKNERSNGGVATGDRKDFDEARMHERFRLARLALGFVGVALLLLALQVPLQSVEHMVEDVAGEDTNLNLGLTVKLSVTIVLSVTGLMGAKLYSQRKRLQEQRETIKKHEKRNTELDKENTQLRRRIEQTKGQGDDPKRKKRR